MAVGRRMSVRDGDWLAYDHIRVIGPLAGVTADRLREALLALQRRYPTHRAMCRMDRAARRWIPMTAPGEYLRYLEASVREPPGARHRPRERMADDPFGGDRAGGMEVPVALRTALLAEPLGDRPLCLMLCGDFVGIRMSHAVGDGAVFNSLLPELLLAAVAGREPAPPFPSSTRLPLARAALRFFAQDPRRMVSILTTPRPVAPEPVSGAAKRLWLPEPHSSYVRSSEDLLPRIRGWRDRYARGASGASVLFAAALAAFEECGLPQDRPGAVILVDARRYLSKRSTVDGNFAVGPYVVPARPRDPLALQAALSRSVAAGQPLGILAAHDVRTLRERHQPRAIPRRVCDAPSPQLTLTHIGRLEAYAELPWTAGPADRFLLSAPTPGSPEGVTVTFAEFAGVIHLNITFHRSTFDVNSVRRAAELICADPVGLLEPAVRQPGDPPAALSPSGWPARG